MINQPSLSFAPATEKTARIYRGDCAEVLRQLADNSIDAIVTDPPAGIGFMGKEWDGDKGGRDAWVAWLAGVMRECYRVLKPGGHALVWALPRTSHWTGYALEEAGFEIRDRIAHLFGTGFPKSLDVSKAIDARLGAERTGTGTGTSGKTAGMQLLGPSGIKGGEFQRFDAPATPEAARWSGWGTALKPACEDWWLARKPLEGTVAANVMAHGTGGLNVDGCRIEGSKTPAPVGRWPAHVVLDEEAARMLDAQSGVLKSGGVAGASYRTAADATEGWGNIGAGGSGRCVADSGGASRFFKVCKETMCQECASARDAALSSDRSASGQIDLDVSAQGNARPGATARSDSSQDGERSESSQERSTRETRNGSKRKGANGTQAIQNTESVSSRASLQPSMFQQDPATPAAVRAPTDTTTITTDRWKCDSCVARAISESTSLSPDPGVQVSGERFKYTAKPSKREKTADGAVNNDHPTPKSIALMRWLARLITPPGGIVLDPFLGSGSTGVACAEEGFSFIGIEQNSGYFEIARKRIELAYGRVELG